MRSSPEEAIAFFKRWQEDKALVHAMLSAGTVTVVAKDAFIVLGNDGTVQVESLPGRFLLKVPLTNVETYQYVTARDFWPEIRTQTDAVITGDDGPFSHGWVLTMKDADNVFVSLFEQEIQNRSLP